MDILKAEDFLKDDMSKRDLKDKLPTDDYAIIECLMVNYAKLHVKEAKRQIVEKYGDKFGGREGWGKELIEQVYPLDSIK